MQISKYCHYIAVAKRSECQVTVPNNELYHSATTSHYEKKDEKIKMETDTAYIPIRNRDVIPQYNGTSQWTHQQIEWSPPDSECESISSDSIAKRMMDLNEPSFRKYRRNHDQYVCNHHRTVDSGYHGSLYVHHSANMDDATAL